MKRIYILLFFSIYSFAANAQFIMTFEVENSLGLNIVVPISGGSYTIDFGDGILQTNQNTHTYATPGTYKVTVTGSFNRIYFGSIQDNNNFYKLKTIEYWGNTKWSTMEAAFYGCSNLIINATDVPDLSQVKNMSHMFELASSFNQPIGNWNVSNVTDMSDMFSYAESFNQSLDNWDVSNVTNMSHMFEGASSFNQLLNNWEISKVTDMSNMFEGASLFNQPINKWDVSNVADMNNMFRRAYSFNQPLYKWNVSKVINMDYMFSDAEFFNQDISDWNFNNDVFLESFLFHSDLNAYNYDALLHRFAHLGLHDKTLWSFGLTYCDVSARNYLINTLNWEIYGDFWDGDCGRNIISGRLLYDENNNDCDANDIPASNMLLKAFNINKTSSTISNDVGQYSLYAYAGKYTVEPFNLPSYFTVTPYSPVVTFIGPDETQTVDFCIKAKQTINDLNIIILPTGPARPGFNSNYRLIIENKGTKTISKAFVNLNFDSTKQSFVSAVPNTTSLTTNQLNFNIENLKPFQDVVINLTMKNFTPPTANGGDILNFAANVTSNSNENTPNDNSFILEQQIVNSYDPNDKQVLQGDKILIDQVDQYLHYLIRFQNTGSASAINVRLKDVLDSSVDWNTIQMINASHNYRTKITDGNQIEFFFENINLPHEAQDTVGNNGFIAYKIKPKTHTKVGDVIFGNEVRIYFDYNLPIITNSVSTEVIKELTMGIAQFDLNKDIFVYPNPTDDFIYITSDKNILLKSAKIYSLDGRELFYQEENLKSINIKNLNSGIYILQVETNEGTVNKKIIVN